MGRVIHFEIQAEDPERAAKFYQQMFDWEIKEFVIPGVQMKNENRYWLITTGPDTEPGINGGILFRRGPAPVGGEPVNAFVCTVDVKNLDESMKKVKENGGTVAMPKMAVPNVGWLGYCKDLDGNIFGMMQSDENAK